MTGSVLDRPEVRVESDPATPVWSVAVAGEAYRVREWTWGERRRLVDRCVLGGTFDRDGFVRGLVELVVSPVPPEEDVPVLAAAALRVLGVDPEARPASLLAAEAVLAERWGWGPAEVDHQPAPRIDRHVAALAAIPVEPSGWHRIEVVDD